MSIRKALRRLLRVEHRRVLGATQIPSIVLVSTTQEHSHPATPATATPLLPPEIWTIIIHYAADFYLTPSPLPLCFLDTPSTHNNMSTKLALCLVSRPFSQLAQVVLWERVVVRSETQARNILKAIQGKDVRHLSIQTPIPAELEYALLASATAERLLSYESINSIRLPLNVLAQYLPNVRHLALVFAQSYTCTEQTSFEQLTSLKLTLPHLPTATRATPFETLARFLVLPELKHLSVLSSDAYYGMPGFEAFFDVHGGGITQLELGGVEEFHEDDFDGEIPSITTTTANARPRSIPLSRWCPSLTSFICSSDAEWNWEEPDWIAPHVLLPTHAGLEVVGIKSIHNRINTSLSHHHESPLSITPFFPLVTQFASLLNPDAFPRLRYIRDLSQVSGEMRLGVPSPTEHVCVKRESTASSSFAYLSSAKARRDEYDSEDDREWDADEEEEQDVRSPMMTYAFDPCPTTAAAATATMAKGKGKGKEKEQTWKGRWRREFPKSSPSAVYVDAESVAGSERSLVSTTNSSSSHFSSSGCSDTHCAPVLSDSDHRRVLKFWASVLRACQSRDVWLEDWEGVNITMGGLRRVAAVRTR